MKQGTLAIFFMALLGLFSFSANAASAFQLQVNGVPVVGTGVVITDLQVDIGTNTVMIELQDGEIVLEPASDPGLDPNGDEDSDGVLNKNDNCPYTGGANLINGCPDTDNDGVVDTADNCPNTHGGPNAIGGCPDSDDDGVIDSNDSCPNTQANATVDSNGCEIVIEPGDCVPSATIECGYDVSFAEWHSGARTEVSIEVPRGKTLVSTFDTTSDSSQEVKFSFWTSVGVAPAFVNAWISTDLNSTVNQQQWQCRVRNQAGTYKLVASTTGDFFDCPLQRNTTYFLHIEHVDPNQSSSRINREMTTWN